MLRFVTLLVLIAMASAGSVKFMDCGHHEVTDVRIDACTSDPCVLHKGHDIHLEVDFTANQDTKKAEIEIFAKLGEVEIQVPGVPTNACVGMGLTCPLKKGMKYTIKYSAFLPKLVPNISTTVKAKLIGDDGLLACGSVHGEVKD